MIKEEIKIFSSVNSVNWYANSWPRHPAFSSSMRGMTLLEVALAVAILSILAGAVLPFQSLMTKRARELVLHETLREIRRAIDRYRDDHSEIDSGPTRKLFKLVYPATWEDLTQAGYLRRVPKDPMTGERIWKIVPFPGFRAEQGQVGEPGGIFDVRSSSEETAIDGSRFDEW